MKRYIALDSWRGLCACLVVLYHFAAYSHVYGLGLIRGGYLFVDFFFVLSGFVITGSYRDRLLAGFPVRTYILLRLGRIYPLHLFILICFVIHECLLGLVPGADRPFAGADNSFLTLAGNILLVHGLGVFDRLTWNGPSWSISTEFLAYIIFAGALLFLRRRLWLAEIMLVIAAPAILASTAHPNMDITYDFGLLRCLYGFFLGSLCYRLHEKYLSDRKAAGFALTAAEITAVLGAAAFAILFQASKISILSPFLFAALVLIFAQEGGAVSRCLKARPFVFLGALSYSVYMVHILVQTGFYNAGTLAGSLLKTDFYTHLTEAGLQKNYLGQSLWQGDLLYAAMFAAVIAASCLVHYLVEKPCHDRVRAWVLKPEAAEGKALACG